MPAQIGVSDLYYSLLLTDVSGGTSTYQAPVRIAGLISININPNSSSESLFADNGPMETASTLGNIEVEINTADLPLDIQSVLLGHTIDSDGIMMRKGTDTAPWLAIGFKALKSNGKYRYVWLTKGKFAVPSLEHTTKQDSVEFQTPTINGNFVKRECDGVWLRQTDEDLANYKAAAGTNWFTSVNYDPA